MKNVFKLKAIQRIAGVIALVTLIGFSFTACGGGDDTISTNDGGGQTPGTTPGGGGLPALTGTVFITGLPGVGQTLTANIAALGGSGNIAYQWKRGTTDVGTDSVIYLVQTADAGSTITVTVTRSGNSGSVTSTGIQIPAIPASIDVTVRNTTEWDAALNTIKNGGNGTTANPKTYTITVSGNVMVNGSAANSFGSAYYIAVTINGNGKLYLLGQGSLLNIYSNQTVYIDGASLTMEGLKAGQNDSSQNNNRAVVSVSGGTLELRRGFIINNTNSNTSYNGGGVYIQSGSFTMSGGTITGNTSDNGGGVGIAGGSFTMTGGNITNNSTSGGSGMKYGGGVYIQSGSFTMSGGTISGNTCGIVPPDSSNYYGFGGGVCVYYNSSFTMTGGTITGNSARGGMNMSSSIYDSIGLGGTWTGISGSYFVGGGGVYIFYSESYGGSFTKSGGSISGNNVTPSRNASVVNDNYVFDTTPNGKEVLWNSSPVRYRNTPLGTADNISTNTMTGWGQ